MIFPSGARAIVLNEKGEVLLAQRQDLHTWGFPGGRIETGETPEETVVRETKEETGVKIKVERLVAVCFNTHFLVKSVVFFFLGKKVGGKEKREIGETLAVRWISQRELKNYLSPRFLKVFNLALSADEKVKFFTEEAFPVPFSKLPFFIWRRTIGKKLKLVEI